MQWGLKVAGVLLTLSWVFLAGCGYQTIPYAKRCTLPADMVGGQETELLLSIGQETHSLELIVSEGAADRGRKPGIVILDPESTDSGGYGDSSLANDSNEWRNTLKRHIGDAKKREYVVMLFPAWKRKDARFIGPALEYARAFACLDASETYVLAPRGAEGLIEELACDFPDRFSAAGIVEADAAMTWEKLKQARRRMSGRGEAVICND